MAQSVTRTSVHASVQFDGLPPAITLADSSRNRRLHAPLPQRIAVAERHGPVGERLAVDRDAIRRAGLVLAAIAAADGPFLVVEHVEVLFQFAINLLRHLRHAVLLHQRKHGRLDRREPRMKLHHHALLRLAVFVRRLSSQYAWHRKASVARSAPADGSMTCGTNRSPVMSSR